MVGVDRLEAIARDAGAILRGHFNNVSVRYKRDRSLVTEADLASEGLILDRLAREAPGIPVLAEEASEDQGSPPARGPEVFVVDPLDGTAAFSAGFPIWGVSIGLVRQGTPVKGVFYLPLLDEAYAADEEQLRWQGQPLSPAPPQERLHSESVLCAPSNLHRRYRIDFPGKVRVFGSAVFNLCMVARGAAVAALVPHVHAWDLAAGLAMCARTGRVARTLEGRPFQIETVMDGSALPEPLLVAHPTAHELLKGRIRPA